MQFHEIDLFAFCLDIFKFSGLLWRAALAYLLASFGLGESCWTGSIMAMVLDFWDDFLIRSMISFGRTSLMRWLGTEKSKKKSLNVIALKTSATNIYIKVTDSRISFGVNLSWGREVIFNSFENVGCLFRIFKFRIIISKWGFLFKLIQKTFRIRGF